MTMNKFSKNDTIPQHFPFHSSSINYIIKNASSKTLLKLFQTCKYFYSKSNVNIVETLAVDDFDVDYFHDKYLLHLNAENCVSSKFKNLWILDSFRWHSNFPLDKLIPKNTICTIKYLSAFCEISWNDFQILSNYGGIVELNINTIVEESGEWAPLENILAAIPSATTITISNTFITWNTSSKLLSQNRKQKIETFDITIAKNLTLLDPELFAKFLIKNGLNDDLYIFDYGAMFEDDPSNGKAVAEFQFHEKFSEYLIQIRNDAAAEAIKNNVLNFLTSNFSIFDQICFNDY